MKPLRPSSSAPQPHTLSLAGGAELSRMPMASPLPPAGHRQLRCHYPTSRSPIRSPRGDRVAPPLRRQRSHGSHRHGSAAGPLCCGQRGFPFPATSLRTLPKVTAPAALGRLGGRAESSAVQGGFRLWGSHPPTSAAGQGASAGSRPHPPPAAQLQGQRGSIITWAHSCAFFITRRERARRSAASADRNIARGRGRHGAGFVPCARGAGR